MPAAEPADDGPRATVDGAGDFDDVDPGAQVVPSLVAGAVDGLERDAVLAIAVGGRVVATTRTFADGDRIAYSVVIPPSSLRPGRNAVAVLQVGANGKLRPIG